MTDTEAKALALVNEIEVERYSVKRMPEIRRKAHILDEALCRAIEREAAEMRELKERFSEVAKAVLHQMRANQLMQAHVSPLLAPFILPAPDPLKSWLHKSGYEGNSVVEQALADLVQNGGKIVGEAGE